MGLFELVVCEWLHWRHNNTNPGYQV